MAKYTELEQKVLDGFALHGGSIYSDEIHAYAKIDKTSVGGVIASLVKKGKAMVEKIDGREYVSLNEDV